MRHEAQLDRLVSGYPQRVHLQGKVDRGVATPAELAELQGPPFPEPYEYFWQLWEWVMELHGRSGIGMNGLAPLSYSVIADWARLTGNRPTPHEVDALIRLDSVLLVAEATEA